MFFDVCDCDTAPNLAFWQAAVTEFYLYSQQIFMDPKRRRYTVFYIYTYNIEKLYVQSFEFIAWYAYAIHIFAVGYVIFY